MSTRSANNELAQKIATSYLDVVPHTIQEQTGGLSGTRVWRVESVRGTFALRQYPSEFPTQQRLPWLHDVLKKVQDGGCALLSCPVSTREGGTWLEQGSHAWEMLTWIHGEPLLEEQPSRELLSSTTAALANLHKALSKLQLRLAHDGILPPVHADGLRQRFELLQQWLTHDEQLLRERITQHKQYAYLRGLYELVRELLHRHQPLLVTRLRDAHSLGVPIFPVLRDVQPAHVIFEGARVAGVIDVGAMRFDSPMADLARLLQRWRYTEPNWYATALAAYQNIRDLHKNELCVLDVYDYSARLLTGVQWLRWLVLEERAFENSPLVNRYIERAVRELKSLPTNAFGSDPI